MSDLHLEFGPFVPENKTKADVLIVAGDAVVASLYPLSKKMSYVDEETKECLENFDEFFKVASQEFDRVIHINGNHEHYSGDVAKTSETLKKELFDKYNITHLEKESVDIGEVLVYGGTLWTDFAQGDYDTMQSAARSMNDYYGVANTDRPVTPTNVLQRFEPEDAYESHLDFKIGLNRVLSLSEKPVIVVTHHAPSFKSVNYGKQLDRYFYASNLEGFITQHSEKIPVWCHGHLHTNSDYQVLNTRILCNPRGYHGYSLNSGFDTSFTFEV